MSDADPYLIVGAGLAGASAIEGIREMDARRPIVLIGADTRLPYHRPPLSKQLWSGKKQVADIFVRPAEYYEQNGVRVLTGTRVVALDARNRCVRDDRGREHRFHKLLLATGGSPAMPDAPGHEQAGVCGYRDLGDYLLLRHAAVPARAALVIGGSFLASEMTAALATAGLHVTWMMRGPYLCHRVFPEDLARALERTYRERGVRILTGVVPAGFERLNGHMRVSLSNGETVVTEVAVAGLGIRPATDLAAAAGLTTGDGVIVDAQLRTSHADIYAAGDLANFPCPVLRFRRRVEHWDNARQQGRLAGRNLAGAAESYEHLPYFFSDLFDFGYEAVGEVDSQLEVTAAWEQEYRTGVLTYRRDGRVRGMVMCNLWDRIDAARETIRRDAPAMPAGNRSTS